jgi:hypothetical protein
MTLSLCFALSGLLLNRVLLKSMVVFCKLQRYVFLSHFVLTSRFKSLLTCSAFFLQLVVGSGHNFCPRNGSWNFHDKVFVYWCRCSWTKYRVGFLILSIIYQKLVEPVEIKRWGIVNFSSRCDIKHLCSLIKKCSEMKGMVRFSGKKNLRQIHLSDIYSTCVSSSSFFCSSYIVRSMYLKRTVAIGVSHHLLGLLECMKN